MLSREEKSEQLLKEWELEEKRKKFKKRLFFGLGTFFFLAFFFLGSFSYMRFVGTSGLVVREYRVVNEMLPSSFHGLKIVHFSDLHYNSTFDENDLKLLVKKVNQLKPDLIVFTGDLTDQNTVITENDLKVLVEQMNQMNASLGLYAIRGNHDYETSHFDIVFTKTKFKILDNNYDLIYSKGTVPIFITGFGSMLQEDVNIEQAFSLPNSSEFFTIGLIHEPDLITEILTNYPVQLALAGHSHNGQVRLPGIGAIYSVKGASKYPNEFYKVGDTDLFVSGGLGTSKYKLRFWNRPSINFYRVVEK